MKAWTVAVAACLTLGVTPAMAQEDPEDDTKVTGGRTAGGLSAGALNMPDNSFAPATPAQHAQTGPAEPSFQLGETACAGATALEGSEWSVSFCQTDVEPTTPVLTVGLIRRAFAELKLPAGKLVIEPPDGLTLVNFDTNFYTTSTSPISRTVTLLGRAVTLQATPDTYTWHFDDGQTLTTREPGAPYPRLDVTHNYLRKGSYRPSLSTTYTGRYRVGTGPWRQIPGTVTIDGTGQPLRAIEAQPKLVGH